MVPRSILIAPATRLLVGCCISVGTATAWGQPTTANDPAAAAPNRPATPPDSASAQQPLNPPPALDTWGTAAPKPPEQVAEVPPTQADSPPGVTDASPSEPQPTRGEPSDGTTSQLSTPDGDDPSHVRYHLERIEVRGNARTRSVVILRYLPFHAGKELDVDDVEFTLARYRLLGTGFFRQVEFSLRKGSRRGSVVLIVDVVERNTVVVNGVWMGLSKSADTNGNKEPLTAYGGIDVSETNLAGTGITLGGAVGLARDQYALRLRFLDPSFLGTPWMVGLTLLHNRATDFFGTRDVLWDIPSTQQSTRYAVLPYQRFGGSVGIGRDLSVTSQLWFHYRLETITANRPSFAMQNRGGKLEDIEFDILQGRSVFSTVRANFQYDTRDHPFLPTRGWYLTTWGELGLMPLGSDYDFQRFDVSASYYWHKNDSPHVFRLQLFAGAMTGNVPFFEQYYVGDFSDKLPDRMLALNVDRRPSWDFLKTAIREVRYGQYAAQIAGEYRLPIYRGHRSVYGIDLFLWAGVFSVAHRRDLVDPAPNYHGWRRIPIDLTVNAGFRMDTSAGGVVFSLANVLGLLPGTGGKD